MRISSWCLGSKVPILVFFAVHIIGIVSAFAQRPCSSARTTIPLSLALASSTSSHAASSGQHDERKLGLSKLSHITLRVSLKGKYDDVEIDGKSILEERNDATKSKINHNTFTSSNHGVKTPRISILKKIKRKFQLKGGDATTNRGDKYGMENNSTILTPSDAALKVGVVPTLEASKETWQRAYKFNRFMLRWLHYWDRCQPTDSKLALACLWWKAIAGNDSESPVYDYQLSYDLLPPITRWIVHRRFSKFYPRLHHANVEIRTAYLDNSVSNLVANLTKLKYNSFNATILTPANTQKSNDISEKSVHGRKKIRLIVMGGGYDTRSFKLLEQLLLKNGTNPHQSLLQRSRQKKFPRRLFQRQKTHTKVNNSAFDKLSNCNYDLECYELDLPEVVHAKSQLLKKRLSRRRQWLSETQNYPKLIAVDFNNLNQTRAALEDVLHNALGEETNVDTIILFEGVMIYLDPGIPHSLLSLCSDVLGRNKQGNCFLCFADRLENIPGGDEDMARLEMENTGWELMDWLSKPGLARHMGVARLKIN
mmetsp:Transcript_9463/g.19000  ORF Transcript_9463/g.19000 Transcript_9463/m.19000 type:complete len:538 (+) Transcript_9463:206-1819(+)